MKLSVITVCYNAAAFIDDCLRSVAEQTWPNIEHIIVDGLSSDATLEIVRRYPHVTRLVSERDKGIYDAMNKGLDLVTGDYVLFLNADDRFASANALAKAAAAIAADPGADVYYGSLEVRPLDGPAHVFHPPPPAEAPEFMVWGCLPHQSTLARPSVFARTSGFDLRYHYHADYDWFLKTLADPAIDVRSVHVVIGSFRLGGASSQLAQGQPEVYAIQNQSPLYATPEWDKKRIEILQEAYLRERLTTAQLRSELKAARERARSVNEVHRSRIGGVETPWSNAVRGTVAMAQSARGAIRDAARSGPRRMRWWALNACVRYLPPDVIAVLRRLRSRGRSTGWRREHINACGYDADARAASASTTANLDRGVPDAPENWKMRGNLERSKSVRAELD